MATTKLPDTLRISLETVGLDARYFVLAVPNPNEDDDYRDFIFMHPYGATWMFGGYIWRYGLGPEELALANVLDYLPDEEDE